MSDNQLSGNLQKTPFADVAGALYREKRTGALTLSSGERARTVIFHEGSPVAVISADPRDHVASLLTAKGKIGAEEAQRLKALPETREALQAVDFVGQDILMWGLKFRFVNLCYDLFRWVDGEYSFEEGAPPKGIFLMKVPTPTLLTKGVKHMPPSLLLERVASALVVAPGAAAETSGTLGEEERNFALLCINGRTVQEVHEAAGMDPVRAREILYTLSALDIISFSSPAPAVEEAPEVVEEIALEEDAPLELDGPGAGGAESPQSEPVPQPSGSEDAFEIERHSYEDEAPPAAAAPDEEAEPVPPIEQDLQEGLKQVEAGIDESAGGAALALETPGLDTLSGPKEVGEGPPEEPPELETPGLEMPSPDDSAPELAPIGFDEPAPAGAGGLEPPGEGIPPPSPDLPPPPWQEEESGDLGDLGAPDSGMGSSPFAPPPTDDEAPRESSAATRKSRSRKPAKPQKERSLFSKLLIGAVLAVAAVVIASGLWMGSTSLRSPSIPLPPIPPAEEVEMAEGLPVPALPKGLGTPVGTAGSEEPDRGETDVTEPPADAPAEPAVERLPPVEPPAAPPDRRPHEAALAAFDSGDHSGAAETWRTMAAESGGAWTIQVVVACQVDTVKDSFERFGGERELFALPLELSGRSCFRVCYGLFGTKGQAQAALEALPAPLQYELSVRGLKGLL